MSCAGSRRMTFCTPSTLSAAKIAERVMSRPRRWLALV
jgi:hypothetical protein